MKNKKGVELSINFIVTLIIAIVIFSFGLKFAYDLMRDADSLSRITLDDIETRIEDLMCDSSQRVCIGVKTRETRPKKAVFFTIGIFNTYEQSDFYIDIQKGEAYDRSGAQITNKLNWLVTNQHTIESNKQKKIGIAVEPERGSERGTYILDIQVCRNTQTCDTSTRYGSLQKIYVVVP